MSRKPKTLPGGATGDTSREVILSAAARIFAERGQAGARIDGIARAAGVNKALLYYYFRSKGQLYTTVLEEQFREFNIKALALLDGPGSPRVILRRYVDLHITTISHRKRFAPLHQQMLMNSGPTLASLVRKYAIPRSRALYRLIKRGVEEGEFRRVDVRHTAISIVAMIVFYFSTAPLLKLVTTLDPYSPSELRRRRRAVIDFIQHGLCLTP